MKIKKTIGGTGQAAKRANLFLFVLFLCIAGTAFPQLTLKLNPPKTFVRLDTSCMTPDAMAFDESGNIFLSITNATTFRKFGAKIIKLNPEGKILDSWSELPIHPATGEVHPMGMAIDAGFLYIADNQHFSGHKNSSRVLRVRIINGKIDQIVTVVSGLNVANGLRVNKGNVFVTDAWTDNERKSGLYKFDIARLNEHPIEITPANRGKYLVHEMELGRNIPNGVGMDGLDFDAKGDIYVGNFSEGSITKFILSQKLNTYTFKQEIKHSALVGCDGIFFDNMSNSLLIVNFLENSILQYNLTDKRLTPLWKNEDAGCNADLDAPCDIAIRNNKLVVVNFDTFTTQTNTTIDNCNTLSFFNIDR